MAKQYSRNLARRRMVGHGCSGRSRPASRSSWPSPRAAPSPARARRAGDSKDPIVVGISLPLTGDFSQPGGEARKGYEIWRDQVNANGGLLGRKVELKITDDASSQDTVVTDYTKLITQDKVDLLLGTFSTLLNFPASAVAEKNGMLYVEPAGGAPKMFDRGFKKLFFAQQATAGHQPDVFVDYIKSLPADQRPKTAAYPTQDDPFTTPVIQSMQKQLEALGVKTVYTTTYPADATNFQTIASAIAAAKPDLVAQGAVFEDGVGLVRSLQQLNYSPKFLFQTSAPSNAGQYSDGIGEKNTEGVFYTVSWNEKAKTPGNDKFVAEYAKRYNGDIPAEDAADAYAAAQVLQAASKAVQSLDQDKLADVAALAHGRDDPRRPGLGPDGRSDVGVPAGPVAARAGGDRGSEGRGHRRLRRRQDALAVRSGPVARARTGHRALACSQNPEEERMTQLVQALVLGLLIGGVYALMASGLTLIFGVMNIINVAHGALLILVAFITWKIWSVTGADPILLSVVMTPVMFGLGWLLYKGVLSRISGSTPGMSVLLTFGIAITIEGSSTSRRATSSARRRRPTSTSLSGWAASRCRRPRCTAASRRCSSSGCCTWSSPSTWTGRAIRATAQNASGAALVGIQAAGVAALAFAWAPRPPASAGRCSRCSTRSSRRRTTTGSRRLLGIIVLGGMGSLAGALVGALVLGLAETLTATYLSLQWSTLIFYAVIMVVLLFRPRACFGARLRQDVIA